VAKLSENIVNRVDKLPKPSNYAQALIPIFEAISNAAFAVEDRWQDAHLEKGCIELTVVNLSKPQKMFVTISDNGMGLDDKRYGAFCELDTDFKKDRGGKGVGRLFWLDAFEEIWVESRHADGKEGGRSFKFVLSNDHQIVDVIDREARAFQGTTVSFLGVRDNEYRQRIPKRVDGFIRYFTSHFISDFLMQSFPEVRVHVDGKDFLFPKEVSELVQHAFPGFSWVSEEFGPVRIVGFLCDPSASAGLDGFHQLHLLANGRTVESRKIDGLVGLGPVKHHQRDDLCLQICAISPYLDLRVNEGRTAFTFAEAVAKEFTRQCVEQVKDKFIKQQVTEYLISRSKNYGEFIERYPIYDFDDPAVQLDKLPFNANNPEEFASGLVKYQVRREEARQDKLQAVLKELEGQDASSQEFSELLVSTAKEIQNSEKLSLAQHVVRRKLILELLDVLLRRYRNVGDRQDHYLENTVHSVLVPTGVSATDASHLESRSHDLWVVDERLAFTRAFASDRRLDAILAENGSALRPDIIVWDLAYGLALAGDTDEDGEVDISKPITEMMIIELKKPMRKGYAKVEDNVEQQILKYVRQLKDGEIEGFSRDRVRVSDNCIFHCFVVADVEGDLKDQVSHWDFTPDGQGRHRPIGGHHRGSITITQWKDLINDAWMRNRATLNAAGLRRTQRLIGDLQRTLKGEADRPEAPEATLS
jgi:hypothetical protein